MAGGGSTVGSVAIAAIRTGPTFRRPRAPRQRPVSPLTPASSSPLRIIGPGLITLVGPTPPAEPRRDTEAGQSRQDA
jgi:hypothetical protein